MPPTAGCALIAFGQILRTGRLDAGLTQDELAERIGIGQSTLSAYERGDSEPILSIAIAAAEATGIDIDDLAAPFRSTRRLEQVAS